MKIRSLSITLTMLALLTSPAWSGDKDKDGVPDKFDECPTSSEDIDLFQDNDGCADPDDDSDKVCDPIITETNRLAEFTEKCTGIDKCPEKPEDIDGFEDADGCPDLDNDADGISDKFDKCPNEAEDLDGFEDADGCPDLDNDADGLKDTEDKCPAVAEDKDGFEDTDGCPDLDNDNDGIPDVQDKCPNQSENKNGFEDEDGCEDVAEKPIDSITIMPIHFETGTSNIDYNGKIYLDDIAKRLVAWKNLNVGIRVWEARKGKLNAKTRAKEDSVLVQTTSAKANSVAKYLSEKGVSLERIQVKGEGPLETMTPEEAASTKPGTHKVVMEILPSTPVIPEGTSAQ